MKRNSCNANPETRNAIPHAADRIAPGVDSAKAAPGGKGLRTELVFILDASGSMHHLTNDTIGGFNSMLDKNREEPGEATVTTVLFNHKVRVIHDRADICEVPHLTRKDYSCNGCTALLDAVGQTIERIDLVQSVQPAGYAADKVLFIITTDGMENASRTYTYDRVKHLIEKHREAGWEFLFIGANIDAAAEAGQLGIPADYAAGYVPDGRGTEVLYNAMSDAVFNARAMGCASPSSWRANLDEDMEVRGGN